MLQLRVPFSLLLALTTVVCCLPREKKTDLGEEPAKPPSAEKRSKKSRKSAPPDGPKAAAKRKKAQAKKARALKKPPRPVGKSDPALSGKFKDNFDRTELGPDWRTTSERWALDDGRLCVSKAHNHPAWLAKRLPVNARIVFDAVSYSSDGDIKAEFWGDGRSTATGASYDNATSYLTIFGGWKNQFHVLARIDEHAKDRPEIRIDSDSEDLRAQPVEPERTYRFKVERRDGRTIQWLVDDIEILKLADKAPLRGKDHQYFGFNNWSVRVCFDNLEIAPL